MWAKTFDNLDSQLLMKHGTAYGGDGDGLYFNYFENKLMLTSPYVPNAAEGAQTSLFPLPN